MEPDSQETTQPTVPISTVATPTKSINQSILIPVAILLGFGMVAAAIFFSGTSSAPVAPGLAIDTTPTQPEAGDPSNIAPVTEADHIRGNPNAPIMIVEYSDYDCPFCKNFHETMNQVMAKYGGDGKVAWVYRHFPLQQLHPNAPIIAHASECVADLAGNSAFWDFSDLVFGERGTNEPTNLTRLEEFAVTAGADREAFGACMDENRFMEAVEADFNNGVAVGARGTPHSVIIVGEQQGVINGAQPYSAVEQIVENLLAQIEGQAQ